MLINQTAVTSRQKHDLSLLLKACRLQEPITLGLPEDGDQYLMICRPKQESDSSSLLACLIICKVQEDLWECYAFTHPDFRRQGYFSRLLKELCAIAREQEALLGIEIDLAFLSDGNSPDGLAAAQALEMTFWYSEYQMKLDLKTWNPKQQLKSPAPRPFRLCRQIIHEDSDDTDGWICRAFFDESTDTCLQKTSSSSYIGACRLIPYDSSRFYLYHVEIQEALRSQGWGTCLLHAVLCQLPPESSVILQVSSLNEPALRLYKKAGFRVTETLSYYLY
ncbi:MAG: GNAT family N-acetyltransferase [Lachnospiraceae bacterium]|nr:GNAT family N-acetyltransferase [Lachnospiraceae bacterium]